MRAFIVLLLFFALFSGCSAPSGEVAVEDPCLVESADDYSCAEEQVNSTVERPHLHDYWRGQDRIAFEPVVVATSPFLCNDGQSIADLRPADGDTVIQGTARLEATLSWTPAQADDIPGPTELWVKTAADSEAWMVQEIASGDTVVLETTNEQNDLPHQMLSAWSFQFVMRPDHLSDCYSYSGEVTLEVTIERGLEIPLYPGHPDRWNGTDTLPLLDRELEVFYYAGDTSGMCLDGPTGGDCLWHEQVPDNGSVVPNDADVHVTVEHLGDSPLRTRLGFHGADTRELAWPEPVEDDGTTRTYVLPAPGRGDGPYALQSQWAFHLVPEEPTRRYSGEVRLTVEAVDAYA